jgi:outer membrane autotransporter protein
MANTITATSVGNAGTLSLGNTIQTIIGNYTQNSGGIFQIGIINTGSFGQLNANTVDLSQSGNINVIVGANASIHNGDSFNIINGTITSPVAGFHVSDNSVIWNFAASVNNSDTAVDLIASINPSAYNVCQGTFCHEALNTIIGQVAAGNPIFSRFATLSTDSELYTAASQATPELTNENIQTIQWVTKSVMDIIPMWSTLHGKSAGDAMLYQPGKMWLKPYGGSITQDENNDVPGFNATVYGAVIGKDIQLSDDWLFGGAFAAGGDHMNGKSPLNGQSISSSTYQGMLYGAKKFPNQFYVASQALVGYQHNNTERSIPLYSTAEGSFNSWFSSIRAQLGWSTYALNQDLILTPELDVSYLFINQDSYKESGSPMNLKVSSNNNSSLVFGAYGNGAYRVTTLSNQYDLSLSGYVGVARNILNDQPEVTATFVAGGPSFSTFGTQFNEFVFRGGVGLTLVNPVKPIRVSLNYDLQTGNNAYSGVGALTVTYKT